MKFKKVTLDKILSYIVFCSCKFVNEEIIIKYMFFTDTAETYETISFRRIAISF